MTEKVTRHGGLNARPLASLVLFFAGVWLVPSGIALHFASQEGTTKWIHLFMGMHNVAALLFIAGAAAHLFLNRKVLTRYMCARVGEYMQFKRELLLAMIRVSGFVVITASHALHLS